MPPWLKSTLQRRLQVATQRVLATQQPTVVGVTGSVGKTSTVQAVSLVLSGLKRTRSATQSYNNEIGVPLTVVGMPSPLRSVLGWWRVFRRARQLARRRDRSYPEILILELAADRPGDIAYLSELTHPTVGVVTSVGTAHLEFFGDLSAVAREKGTLVAKLPAAGTAVLNADDPLVLAMREITRARVVTFGFHPQADVRAIDVSYTCQRTNGAASLCTGMRCRVQAGAQQATLELPLVLGEQMLSPALAAVAVGASCNLPLTAAVDALRQFTPPPGRMRLIGGIKGTTIIDDSYNSSPLSAQAAVRTLSRVPSFDGRKFAILGDMRELGAFAVDAHRELGGQVTRAKLDVLVAVGELARDIARGATQEGMPEDQVFTFADAPSAGRFLQDRIKPGDVLLVKGSQAVRLERIVKELMREPQRAAELLVRQGVEWRR